ncbi:MAG: cytochrome c biogenesis heme-transporting ATPase CcmA [Rhodoferax sp.]
MNQALSLTFDDLGCSKGGRVLFSGVRCRVQAGQWLYVAGANGVGKTSLLRMVCGLSPTEHGRILWNDQPINQNMAEYRSQLRYLGHTNALQESLSVVENLRFATALAQRHPTDTELTQALTRFGLRGRGQQLVRHLSQGQKRRVALTRLALCPAPLWILDEPFVAMDEAGIRLLAELICDHLGQGGLVVLTSHQRVPIGNIPPKILELQAAP